MWHHDVTNARTCQFFRRLFDRLPVRISTSDLHHRILRKKTLIMSELMILECSFKLKLCLHTSLRVLSIWLSTTICKHHLFKRCRGEVHVQSTIRRILTEQAHHTTKSIKASESLSVTTLDKEKSSLQPVGPGLLAAP